VDESLRLPCSDKKALGNVASGRFRTCRYWYSARHVFRLCCGHHFSQEEVKMRFQGK
jgi:hypothetical protein